MRVQDGSKRTRLDGGLELLALSRGVPQARICIDGKEAWKLEAIPPMQSVHVRGFRCVGGGGEGGWTRRALLFPFHRRNATVPKRPGKGRGFGGHPQRLSFFAALHRRTGVAVDLSVNERQEQWQALPAIPPLPTGFQ